MFPRHTNAEEYGGFCVDGMDMHVCRRKWKWGKQTDGCYTVEGGCVPLFPLDLFMLLVWLPIHLVSQPVSQSLFASGRYQESRKELLYSYSTDLRFVSHPRRCGLRCNFLARHTHTLSLSFSLALSFLVYYPCMYSFLPCLLLPTSQSGPTNRVPASFSHQPCTPTRSSTTPRCSRAPQSHLEHALDAAATHPNAQVLSRAPTKKLLVADRPTRHAELWRKRKKKGTKRRAAMRRHRAPSHLVIPFRTSYSAISLLNGKGTRSHFKVTGNRGMVHLTSFRCLNRGRSPCASPATPKPIIFSKSP
ncbi:hypothetical protein LZ31DRAFT_227495 [Colletotrichum somersetense]|nr:hypothetical protein LZ31DRAFT_227495 [Colletotrichum somersetense]